MKMGETHVVVKVYGPLGAAEVEMLADTGSTLTKIDESTAGRLGIVPTDTATVELADGTDRKRGLAEAKLEIMGDIATVRILIGPDGEEPLLGLTTLESLRLKVNPIERRLEPAKFIEYASSSWLSESIQSGKLQGLCLEYLTEQAPTRLTPGENGEEIRIQPMTGT